jgi:hypothetical protein
VIPTEQALDRLRLLFREELRSALGETRRAAVLAEREECARLIEANAAAFESAEGDEAPSWVRAVVNDLRALAAAIRRRPPP